MNTGRTRSWVGGVVVVVAILILSACNPPGPAPITPAESVSPSPTVIHLTKPAGPVYLQTAPDCVTGAPVPAAPPIQPAPGCDSWERNRYERPFNGQAQDVYDPDLDILQADLGQAGQWFYLRIGLYDTRAETGGLDGLYGIEFDLDFDGRGDFLILAQPPAPGTEADWRVEGVQVWSDSNDDVGNDIPLQPDQPAKCDGYDLLVFNQGEGTDPDLAWVRVFFGRPSVVEIAFKSTAIDDQAEFKWWAWSDQGIQQPHNYDFHDAFTHEEAGDAYQASSFFPAKAIHAVDNTCASIWGAPPSGDPSLCANEAAVPTPTATATSGACIAFDVVLSGAQEVPSNPSPATGSGVVEVNTAINQLSYSLTFSGLAANETGAHIHGFAASGVNAPVLFPLPLGSPKVGVVTFTEAQEPSILAGLTYINIHSTPFPGGEIRGQIAGPASPCGTPTATATSGTCVNVAGVPAACTPTPTPTPCLSAAGVVGACTPTSTATPTRFTSTPSSCLSATGAPATCTPTPTATRRPTRVPPTATPTPTPVPTETSTPTPSDTTGPSYERIVTSGNNFYDGTCTPNAVTVTAHITDPDSVVNIVLWYRVGNSGPFTAVGMNYIGGNFDYSKTVYSTDLAPGVYGVFEFYLTSQDGLGNASQSAVNNSVSFNRCR